MFRKFLKLLASCLFPAFFKFEVLNQPAWSKDQGILLAVNHIHGIDPILISYTVYPVWLHHLAKEEIFRVPVVNWLVTSLGAIPINRQRPKVESIKKALDLLWQHKIVCIFPQGTRRKKAFGDIKKGTARLALEGNFPIIPVAITGLEKVRFWGLFMRPKVRILFGEPISTTGRSNTKEEIDALTSELQARMESLYREINLS